MLRISMGETATEERWVLCGRLTAPWVSELRAAWKEHHRVAEGRACIVDLNEITLIDKSGESCLRELKNEGAKFVASGVYIKHVIEHLNGRRKAGLSTLLSGLFGCLTVLLVASIAPQATCLTHPADRKSIAGFATGAAIPCQFPNSTLPRPN